MSMQAINFALTLPIDEPGPRLLLLLIAHHVNWKTGDMYVSQEELADEARMSSRSVRNHLGALEEAGLITRTQQRDENGRRGIDRIELIGYLQWQDVLYNGGTIPSPESRRKKPPENSAGSEDANRKNSASQPEKNGSPTGSSFPVNKEPSLTIDEPLAHASAPATQSAARPVRQEYERLILASDNEWSRWLTWHREQGQYRAADQFRSEGAMIVFAPYPMPGMKQPMLAPEPGKPSRLALEAARKPIIRDPTGEAA